MKCLVLVLASLLCLGCGAVSVENWDLPAAPPRPALFKPSRWVFWEFIHDPKYDRDIYLDPAPQRPPNRTTAALLARPRASRGNGPAARN